MNECCESGPCCEEQSCEDYSCYDTGDAMLDGMLSMSDEAWGELMKEKIKKHYEETMGKQMDKMAEALANASMALHGGKMKHDAEVAMAVEKGKESMKM